MVGEVHRIGALEGFDQPAGRDVVGHHHAAPERDALAVDGCLDHQFRTREARAAFVADVTHAGGMQPHAPVRVGLAEGMGVLVQQGLPAQVGGARQGMFAVQQGRAAHRKDFLTEQ